MTVDDAQSTVHHALEGSEGSFDGLHHIRLADLNETEREHALDAIHALHALDDALAERSGFKAVNRPWIITVGESDAE
jgi:hypothetical protein